MELGFTFENEINLCKKEPPTNWKYKIGNKVPYLKKRIRIPHRKNLKVKKEKYKSEPKIKQDQTRLIYCKVCDCWIQHRIKAQHEKKTIKHLINNYIM